MNFSMVEFYDRLTKTGNAGLIIQKIEKEVDCDDLYIIIGHHYNSLVSRDAATTAVEACAQDIESHFSKFVF